MSQFVVVILYRVIWNVFQEGYINPFIQMSFSSFFGAYICLSDYDSDSDNDDYIVLIVKA
jgi:hypothetical protein